MKGFKDKIMERPNRDDYWMNELKTTKNGSTSIPLDHVQYEWALEMYCTYLEKQLSLKTEKEESVSDDSTKYGVLHGVKQCNASEETDNSTESSVDGTLSKITDDENEICPKCGSSYLYLPQSVVCCNSQCSYILKANFE
jgi:hypothetical protein